MFQIRFSTWLLTFRLKSFHCSFPLLLSLSLSHPPSLIFRTCTLSNHFTFQDAADKNTKMYFMPNSSFSSQLLLSSPTFIVLKPPSVLLSLFSFLFLSSNDSSKPISGRTIVQEIWKLYFHFFPILILYFFLFHSLFCPLGAGLSLSQQFLYHPNFISHPTCLARLVSLPPPFC